LFLLDTKQQSLLFQVDYPEISDNIVPKHRFMSGFEQHVEAPDRRWQYLLFAAEPYETIAFKVIELICISSLIIPFILSDS
jgi:splicing factor 3A subunit 2